MEEIIQKYLNEGLRGDALIERMIADGHVPNRTQALEEMPIFAGGTPE